MQPHPLTERALVALATAAVGVSLGACARPSARDASRTPEAPPSRAAAPEPVPPRVILLALDGVRWQEIFHGADPALAAPGSELTSAEELTPNLHALMREGVALGDVTADSRFLASGPNFISLPGYTEMLTGRPSPCQANDCRLPVAETLSDAFIGASDAAPDEVLVLASWDAIGRVAAKEPEKVVVSTGRHVIGFSDLLCGRHDAGMRPLYEASRSVAPDPGYGDYRPDAYTHALAVARFERVPHVRFAFLGLGDTDEYAHQGRYADYLGAIHEGDRLLGELRAIIRAWPADEAANVLWFVTADHGRGPNFRDHGKTARGSDATWLVAAGGPIPALGALGATRVHHLRDIAPTARALAGLPPVEGDDAGEPIDEIVIGAERALGHPLGTPASAESPAEGRAPR